MPSSAGQVYSPNASFSLKANPNGPWQFGYEKTIGSRFIICDIPKTDGAVEFWESGIGPGGHPLVYLNRSGTAIGPWGFTIARHQLVLHPGPNGELAVVRFIVPATGRYVIKGRFTGIHVPSTDAHVVVNSSSLLSAEINGVRNFARFDLMQSLKKGDKLDFLVGYGADKDYNNDSTALDLHLERP